MQKFSTFLFSLCFLSFLNAQDNAHFTFEENGTTYTAEERMAQKNTYGISVCTFKNFTLDTLMQWGYRDAANKRPVNAQTLFQAGGMSAALTNFAVVRLASEGKIDLDENVNSYLKSWKIPDSRITRSHPVTVRDLLLHRRGFETKSKPSGYAPGQAIPTLLQILNGEAPSQEAAAILKKDKNKKGWSSFYHHLILQQMLEDIHGKAFSEIMQTEVLDPLEMTNSTFRAELTPEQKGNASLGYDKEGQLIPGGRWIYPEEACAGLWTTPLDYAKFLLHLLKAARGEDNRFLSQELAQASINPESGYRALIVLKDKSLYWGGASMGFRTQFYAAPEEEWIAVVFMNSHENWPFMGEFMWRTTEFARRDITQ